MSAVDFEETVEELEAKLQQYGEQLQTVETALSQQPNESALQKLKSDLKEVISLTADLLSFQRDTVGVNNNIITSNDISKQNNKNRRGDISTLIKSDSSVIRVKSEYRDNDDNNTINTNAESSNGLDSTLTTTTNNNTLDDNNLPSITQQQQMIGRTCIALINSKHVHAEILDIKEDSKLGLRVVLRPLTSNNQKQEINFNSISILNPPSAALIIEGALMQAIYSSDGKWYDCRIEKATDNGYRVLFTDYGDHEEVKFDQIRLPRVKKEEKNKKFKDFVTPGGYKLPEYLRIRETDTDAQKIIKKRKAKKLKNEQRSEKQEKDYKVRATNWRKFNQKAISKKLVGYMTGRGHESIFKSSDVSTPVSKVQAAHHSNVVNTFAPRRKHDFNDGDDDDD